MSVAREPGTGAERRLHEAVPDAPAPPRRCDCSTASLSGPSGDIVVLRVAGVVDVTTFPILDSALDEVFDRHPDHLVLDLTELVFCSSRGLIAIARITRAAAADGTRCSMSGTFPLGARLRPLYGPDDAPAVHRTAAAAVLAAVVEQARAWTPPPVVDPGPTTAGADP